MAAVDQEGLLRAAVIPVADPCSPPKQDERSGYATVAYQDERAISKRRKASGATCS